MVRGDMRGIVTLSSGAGRAMAAVESTVLQAVCVWVHPQFFFSPQEEPLGPKEASHSLRMVVCEQHQFSGQDSPSTHAQYSEQCHLL